MKKSVFYIWIILLSIISMPVLAQDGSSLDESFAFCTGTGYSYVALTSTSAQSGPNYDCLGSQPNPTWMHLKISTAGDIHITLSAGSDVDFALWGPYSSLSAAHSGVAAGNAPSDCSYSGSNTESVDIGSSSAGDYFILLVTNFANVTQTVSLAKNSGSGETDCSIMPPSVTTGGNSVSGLSATCYGTVTNDNGNAVTEKGICYGTGTNPTISGSHVTDGSGTGSITAILSGLSQGTTYHYRAYATNVNGTSYGGDATFTTPSNTPPVANSDTYNRFYTDTGVSFYVAASGVLSNDSDSDGDGLSAVLASAPSHGSLTLNSNGSFTYTSNNGYKDQTDAFTYYANDGQVNSNSTATVTINIYTPRFTGSVNNNFSNPANWNCGYVPNESLNIVIAAGKTMVVDQNYTCKNLKFESGASFNCIGGSTLTITGDVLKSTGATAIDVNSSIQVKSSIQIQNP